MFRSRGLGRDVTSSNNRAVGPKVFLCALGLCLAAVTYAQPFPSFVLDTTRHIGRDLYVPGCYVALAASRTGGAVVWGGPGSATHRDRSSRLTRSMDVIDTIPTDIVGPWNMFFSRPAVACSDSGYAVAWDGNRGLWLAFVSASGEVVNRVPVDTEDYVNDYSLVLAARSDRYALVCHGNYASSQMDEIRVTEVGLGGTILRRYTVVRGAPAYPPVREPDVVRGDSAYLVVWQGQDSVSEQYHITARFVWPDGQSADTAIFSIRKGVHAFSPKTAFDGENFWVAWLEETTPYAETVAKVARVTQNGVVLDTGGIIVGSDVAGVRLAAARETTLVALSIPGNVIVGMRFDAEAQLLDSTPILLSTRAVAELAVAAAADTFLVVWRDGVEGVSEATERLAGRRITASGTVVDPDVRDYAFSGSDHRHVYRVYAPIIASDGESFLAVWCDRRADPDFSARLLGRRFDNQGRFLDPEPFRITESCSVGQRPILTYGAGYYFLCWIEGSSGSYALRISRQGEVTDTVPIPLARSTRFAALEATFLRDSMFVVLGGDTTTTKPLVVRVMADGRVLDSVPRAIKVCWRSHFWEHYPSIASIGDTLVMACRLDSADIRILLAVGFYDRELVQLDSVWWPLNPYHPLVPYGTSVACGRGRILVASDPDSRFYKPELWLLDSVGHLLCESLPLPTPGVYGNNFSIAFDGGNFMCAKSGGGFPVVPGYRVTPDGDLLENVRWTSFESTLVTGHSGLALDTLGNVGLVFFTFETEGYMSDRIRAAVFPRLTGGVEEAHGIQPSKYFCQTVIGHVLYLPPGGQAIAYQLMDVCGRHVASLASGPNDVSHLAPGVYFVREAQAQAQAQAVRKVVVTR